MVLSNAERQARYKQRLKDAAASLVLVRYMEGNVDGGLILHDTQMAVVPRVGETVTFRFSDRKEERHKVVAVDYVHDLRDGIDIVDDLVGVRVQLSVPLAD